MIELDQSQQAFCRSNRRNIRLLAPAGCGKTASLLYRCRELLLGRDDHPRFLIVTFTKSASAELKERLQSDDEFECLDGQINVTTLNAYGFRQIRNRVRNPKLLVSRNDYHFAVLNQLRPVWEKHEHVRSAIERNRNAPRRILEIMDNLKSMGFDHTSDINPGLFRSRLRELEEQGLTWRIHEQFELLTRIGILDAVEKGATDGPSKNVRTFYNRFFQFWRDASDALLGQSTFTFEDQKYWSFLDLKSPGADGRRKRPISGVARYDHVLVDEFQDINPLDLSLIKVIVERNRATLTIVGDDDQAIFEWRGASPEYILNPQKYFGVQFTDHQLQTNYRSPHQIVTLSQNLINHNANRVPKKVTPFEHARDADIELMSTDGINERLSRVTEIVKGTEPGRVAVIGRFRRQLIPFQIYYAQEGAPFKTAADLDIFGSKAFDDLIRLLEVWEARSFRRRTARTVDDAITICEFVYRYPLSKRDRDHLRRHLNASNPNTTIEAVTEIKSYGGPDLKRSPRGKLNLFEGASSFVGAVDLSGSIGVVSDGFGGLSFDWERAEDDVWYTDPPLKQRASIAENDGLDVSDLIDRLERSKDQIQEYRAFEDDDQPGESTSVLERPLHLMTAHRAKGKEFDNVVILDTDDRTWSTDPKDERRTEAERRLFYVAFTRAQKKVIMLHENGAPLSPFVEELGNKPLIESGVAR